MLALGVAFARSGNPVETTLRAFVVRLASPAVAAPDATAALGRIVTARARTRGTHLRSLTRTVVVGVPVLGALALLLGSADPVFEHYLERPLTIAPDSLPRHLLSFTGGALMGAALLVSGVRTVDTTAAERRVGSPWSLGTTWTAVMAAVATLMVAFVLVQVSVALVGEEAVRRTSGLTFAEYARSGFWQLLAAAIIAGSVIVAAWCAGARVRSSRERTVFLVAALTLIVCVLIVLASAFRRLALYEHAFGFTWPRLIGHTTVIVLGFLLVCGVVVIVTGRATWLPAAVVGIGVITALGLTAFDPEAFIAERNVARFLATGSIDTSELEHLSADALPPVLEALERTSDACDRSALIEISEAIALKMPPDTGWSSWNLARSRAARSLEEARPLTTSAANCRQ